MLDVVFLFKFVGSYIIIITIFSQLRMKKKNRFDLFPNLKL